MSAALTLVPPTPARPLSPLAEIERLEALVVDGLLTSIDSLTRLRELGAHTERGFALWHQYVQWRFGELLQRIVHSLPDGERLALVESMCTSTADRPRGLPVREQSKLLGVAIGTIQNDRVALGLVTPRARPEPLPAPTGKKYEQGAQWLRRAADGQLPRHPDGLTLVELAQLTGWTEGSASGVLTDLVKRLGWAVKSDATRANQTVHVLTEAGAAGLASTGG